MSFNCSIPKAMIQCPSINAPNLDPHLNSGQTSIDYHNHALLTIMSFNCFNLMVVVQPAAIKGPDLDPQR